MATGLPATRYGVEKKDFIKYLSKNEDITFVFEEETYHIKIEKVVIFPQGYAAVVDRIPTFKDKVVVVDIGSWTVDIFPIINKKPDDANANTIPGGVISCMRTINKQCTRLYNETIDEEIIKSYIMTGKSDLDDKFIEIMERELKCFATNLFNSLREEGYSLNTTQFYFVGGGACIMKNFGGYEQKNIQYILAVYMARYGMGDTATVLNDTTKEWAETVVDDMCNYSISSGVLETENEDGSVSTVSALQVNVDLKNYQDMIAIYEFTDEQIQWVETLMSPQRLTLLGYTGIEGEVTSTSSLTMAEISEILSEVTDPVQQRVCAYALSKVGYPYSQAYRDTGNYYDCSSLAYCAWKAAGVDISYGGSNTAAEEARGLEQAGETVSYSELQPGDLIFFSYTNNGRYKNISHVAIYIGNGKVVEAKSTKYGVVYGEIPNADKIVLIGRPQ